MPRVTVIFGVLLVLLGVVGYLGDAPAATATAVSSADAADTEPVVTDENAKQSVTSLIPAFVGILLIVFGFVAINEGLRMHAMHGAVLVGLLGAIAGGGRAGMNAGAFFANDPELNRRAFFFVLAMAVLCIVYVFLCVRSFIDARKRRQRIEGTAA